MTAHSRPEEEPRDDRPAHGGQDGQDDERGFSVAPPPPPPQWAQGPSGPEPRTEGDDSQWGPPPYSPQLPPATFGPSFEPSSEGLLPPAPEGPPQDAPAPPEEGPPSETWSPPPDVTMIDPPHPPAFAQPVPPPAAPSASPHSAFPPPVQPPTQPPGPEASGRPPVQYHEPWRVERPARRRKGNTSKRIVLTGLAGLAAAAVAAAGFVVLTGGDSGSGPEGRTSLIADELFAGGGATRTDGRAQSITGVAASGNTVVAVGSESGPGLNRGQFLLSTDGGRTFTLVPAKEPDGGDPPLGPVPQHVAAAQVGWAALGPRPGGVAFWTSPDGRSWQRRPTGQAFIPGDRVRALIAHGRGLVAVGSTASRSDRSDAEPVVWTSGDGRTWERLAGDDLDLDAGKGRLELVDVASDGTTLLLHGEHTKDPGDEDAAVNRRVWRSDDGGKTWKAAKAPVPKGTVGLVIGGGPRGLLIVRNTRRDGESRAQVYVPEDKDKWTKAGEIELPGQRRVLRLVSGEQGHVAVVSTAQGAVLQSSTDGATWQDAGTLPAETITTVLGGAMASGQVIVTGLKRTGEEVDAALAVRDQRGGEVPVDLARVAGLQRPDLTVSTVTEGGGLLVAVGGANGDAAVWTSTDGRSWTPGQGQSAALSRRGVQRLSDVARGEQGWLAVGFDAAGPQQPLVVTSKDGRTWQAVDGDEVFRPSGNGSLTTTAATAGPNGHVIVGQEGDTPVVWLSTDLDGWERGKGAGKEDLKEGAGQVMHAVTGGSFGYVAAGTLTDPDVEDGPAARPAVWTSGNGLTWTLQQPELPSGFVDGKLTHLAARGDLVVAAGVGGTVNGVRPLVYVSADRGRTWRPAPPSDPGQETTITALTATDEGFAMTGALGRSGTADVVLWTSADGGAWRQEKVSGEGLAGPGDQRITGLTSFSGALLGVGVTSDYRGDHPVLWRRP